MHIVNVFLDRADCSCGNTQPSTTGGEAQRKAWAHAEVNAPAVVIDRRQCSKQCIDGIPSRDLRVTKHDPGCPQGNEGIG